MPPKATTAEILVAKDAIAKRRLRLTSIVLFLDIYMRVRFAMPEGALRLWRSRNVSLDLNILHLTTEVSYHQMLEYVLYFVAKSPYFSGSGEIAMTRSRSVKILTDVQISFLPNGILCSEWAMLVRRLNTRHLTFRRSFSPLYWLLLASRRYSLPSATNKM